MISNQNSSQQDLLKREERGSYGISEKTKSEYEFVVGIDFGTTYSGIAYSRVGELDGHGAAVVTEISKWPMRENQITSQAPTKSVYVNGILEKWGHQKPGRKPLKGSVNISMFKLHLDESRSVNIPPLPKGISVVKAISDYLKAIFDYACSIMTNTLGNVDKRKLRFCLTVPAVWTEGAKATMREAAIQAGIISINDPQDRLLLVGEPEAAALYCETFVEQYDLCHESTFLICDAGGGTVDLVVYRINEINGETSLIEEVAGDGGMCGSVTLDIRFRNFVAIKVKELTRHTNLAPLNDIELDEITKAFAEGQKFDIYDPSDPNFDADYIGAKLPYRFASIQTEQNSVYIEDYTLLISPSEIIKHIFDPVVDKVLALVESQFNNVDQKLDAIFLVGGFGQSAYLFTKLKNKFASKVRLVCTPSRGEMAIVRGAVLMGLNPRFVKQRVIRRTYGYECALAFEENFDPIELRKADKDGAYYCNKRFLPYATKGDIKDIDYFANTSFMSYYNRNPSLHLFAYDGDPNKIPRYTTDEEVKKIIGFEIKLPHLPGKVPSDLIKINVRFYLYQTEIKLRVEIENHIEIYTGSFKKESIVNSGNLGDDFQNLEIDHGTKDIEGSYVQTKDVREEVREETDIGIQGYIPEPSKYYIDK